MIKFINFDKTEPYRTFKSFYDKAFLCEKYIDAICISSYDKDTNQVESRFVNLKYIIGNEWIFFTNYNSPKARHFEKHNQISAVFYWGSINAQIRIKGQVKKTSSDLSDKHFQNRNVLKNKIAVISNQSEKIGSYEDVIKGYNEVNNKTFFKRPEYWGGYSFIPYYFEFWEGHESRLNKRESYEYKNNEWAHGFLQP